MSSYGHSSNSKTSQPRGRGKSQGWTAFDLKQRQKQLQPQLAIDNDPFPPLPTTPAHSVAPAGSSARSLSSQPFPPKPHNSSVIEIPPGTNPDFAFHKLQLLHPSADPSLIQDIINFVNNDIDKAAISLNEILSAPTSIHFPNNSHAHGIQYQPDTGTSLLENSSQLAADIDDLSSTLEDALKNDRKQLEVEYAACRQGPSKPQRHAQSATAEMMKLILGHLKSIPVEPEWEEEHDVYLSLRRNALKMMRLASRHSRAATNAYMRGDHASAQRESLKAQKEWLDAERLNAEAAREILRVRNNENNPWQLDLHGLHVAEAVQALHEHLKKFETLLAENQPISLGKVKTKSGIVCSSVEPFSSMDVENLDIQHIGFRQRPASLLVITGVGNHSRSKAALPTAVKSFLSENRYHFEEARPGVIRVFPKFRHR